MTNHAETAAPRLLFLFSDTGGGHRSVAEAIIEALELEFGGRYAADKVDFLREYFPWPFRRIPEIYSRMVKYPSFYRAFYYSTNTPRRTRLMFGPGIAHPNVKRRVNRLVADRPSDLVVLTHYMMIPPLFWLRPERRPCNAVVVTDLVSTHAAWFDRRVDRYIVATPEAHANALAHGIDPARLHLVGLPVADRFCRPTADRAEARARYGWPTDRPLVLLVGGGDGMGPLYENAHAIAHSGLDVALVVVAGRNAALQARLEAETWPIPLFAYGFTREMPAFMQAADVVVTKAGPSTICEATTLGRPLILYSRLPGQEEGNVTFITEPGAGVYAPTPGEVVATLRRWTAEPAVLAAAAAAAGRLSQAAAARRAARLLAGWADAACRPSDKP